MVVGKVKAGLGTTSSRLAAPASLLPTGTLAHPHFFPFGKSTGLEDEQPGPILPASHPEAAAFADFLSQGRGDIAGSLPMGNVMVRTVRTRGTASLIWSQPR